MTQLAIGEATPHGATYDGRVNFITAFSARAERVEAVRVFDPEGMSVVATSPCDVAAMSACCPRAAVFAGGYRVHGPWHKAQGHRFNPASYR